MTTQAQKEVTKVLDNLFLIENNSRIWSGKSSMDEAYLTAIGIDIRNILNDESDTAAIGGSVKLIDPKLLRPFHALRKRMERYLQSVGIRFLGGYATPLSRKDNIQKDLDNFKADFDVIFNDFNAKYPQELQKWADANPKWRSFIVDTAPNEAALTNRFKFDWNEYQIQPVQTSEESKQTQAEEKIVKSLSDKLFDEIARDASSMWGNIQGQKSIKTLSPLRKMAAKLGGLGIVDARVNPIAAAINDVLATTPDGKIEGLSLAAVNGLLLLLSDPDKVKQAGQAALNHGHKAAIYAIPVPEDLSGKQSESGTKKYQPAEDWFTSGEYLGPDESVADEETAIPVNDEPAEQPAAPLEWF